MAIIAELHPGGLHPKPVILRSHRRRLAVAFRASAIWSALFAADTVAFMLCLFAWRALGFPVPVELQPWLAVVLAGLLTYFIAQRHYARRIPGWHELSDLLCATVIASSVSLLVDLLLRGGESGLVLCAVWLPFPALASASRHLTRRFLEHLGIWQIPVLFVGGRDSERAMAALRSDPTLGYRVVASIAPEALRRGGRRLLIEHRAEMLVLAGDFWEATERPTLERLIRDRVRFAVAPRCEGLPVLGYEETRFVGHEVVLHCYRNNLAKPAARGLKMVFDLVAAAALTFLLGPLLLAIAMLVRLDGGPALFAHERIGAGGAPFRCFKFRTMVEASDLVLQQHLESNPEAAAEWRATQKLRDDPRVTWIGRILRKSSLDELPQLLNVLRLEMSLVGPRPIVAREIPRYGEDIAYYYETRPGITGLWQVSGRSSTSYQYRVELDRWYVKNWTIWQDLTILLRTIPAVLAARGAC